MGEICVKQKQAAQFPIRILCVMSTLDRGGAESMCMNLYRHMDRGKVQFDFVKHTKAEGAFEQEIKSLGGKIYAAPRMTIKNISQYRKWWMRHFNLHPEHQIVHGHYFTASAVYFEAAKRCGRVTIGHMHTARFDRKTKEILCKRVERYSDYCLACGWDAGKLLYPHRHFIVVNNAVDAQEYRYNPEIRRQYRNALGLENSLVIGIVANFSEPKNPLGVIELFHRLVVSDSKYKLLWIGSGNEMVEQVQYRVEAYGLQDRVILLGVRSDVGQLLQAMDAFILPSLYEGLPVVLIEAQAAGLRCFVSDKVTTEVDITGRCEFLPVNEWDLWRDRIKETDLAHEDTYEAVVQAGYDINYTAGRMQDMYMTIARNT